jgi:tetratricopeptide (TPR) repeat protein
MTKHLLCAGVPRSGTTFTAALLCSHENVVCGSERFSKPAAITPESFTEHGFFHTFQDSPNYAKHLHLKDKFATAQVVGDKMPRAYFHLNQILSRFQHLKVVFLMRDPGAVCASWNSRAGNEQDVSWDRAQIGAYAILEQLIAISQLLAADEKLGRNFLLVSYSALLDERTQAVVAGRIFDFLEVAPSVAVQQFLHAQAERTLASRKKTRTLTAGESRLIDTAGTRAALRELDIRGHSLLADFRAPLMSVISEFATHAPDFWTTLQRTVSEHDPPHRYFDYGCWLLSHIARSDPGAVDRPLLRTLAAPNANAFSRYYRATALESAEADSLLSAVLIDYPDSTRVATQLARICLRDGHIGRANEILDRLLTLSPEDTGLLHMRAVACIRQGDPGHAADLARRAIALDPDTLGIRFTLVDALMRLSLFTEAGEWLDSVETAAPDHPRLEPFRRRIRREIRNHRRQG